MRFARWLRLKYDYPKKIKVFVENVQYYKNDKNVHSTVKEFISTNSYVIRIAASEYSEDAAKDGKDCAIYPLFYALVINLETYFMWCDNSEERFSRKDIEYGTDYILGSYRFQVEDFFS